MTFERLIKKIAFITAAALFVAACDKSNEPAPSTTAGQRDTTVQQGDGRPDPVVTPRLTQEELDMQKYGSANQNGLSDFAGGDRVFFAFDSSALTSEARDMLEKQAEWLNHYSHVRIVVEGHCDERGTREYNLALGERRASAVREYLIALGVPASRVNTISYGKERPAVVGNGERFWSQNRRGVTVIR